MEQYLIHFIECHDFLTQKRFAYNDLKRNNVLLRQTISHEISPVIIDMGKVTLRTSPEIYKLNEKQKARYNVKYPHLAYELRNVYGAKTSMSTDIFSLGYIYKFIADKDNKLLQDLQKEMQNVDTKKRMQSPAILSRFKNWKKKQDSN